MNIKFLMIIVIVVASLVIIEITLVYNGLELPLIIHTLYWVISEYVEPLYIAPYFTDLEIIQKYKNGFPYHYEMYIQHDGKKALHLSAYGQEKKIVDLNIENDDGELFYEIYCTAEFTTISKDLKLINEKLDQCIDKYGQNSNELYSIPNPL